jgi:hypothetical protein
MPNAVCSLLRKGVVKDLGVHTEMLTDGIMDLYRNGPITGARKQLDQGKIVGTIAIGSRYLYDGINRNPDIQFSPVDYTNLPHTIMRNERVVGDQQHHANRPSGSGGLRVRRQSPHQRHRRATAVRTRCLRIAWGQVIHLSFLDL